MIQFVKIIKIWALCALFFLAIGVKFNDIEFWVYSLNISTLILIVDRTGKSFGITEFISFSAVTLWLTVPLLMWDTGADKHIVKALFGSEVLALDKHEYYRWSLPATLALIAGLTTYNITHNQIQNQFVKLSVFLRTVSDSRTPMYLFLIGVFSLVIGPFMPGMFQFIFFLFSQCLYISVLYCIAGKYVYAKWIYLATGLLSILAIASSGMFGELVWWSLIIATYVMIFTKWNFIKKLSLIFIGLFAIFLLQSIKNEYRRLTWSKTARQTPGISLLAETSFNAVWNIGEANIEYAPRLILYRMNQAYIVSRVMKYVPDKEPFAKGETVFVAMAASFVPRFLWPDKPMSGGHENMMRFAKFDPHESTSYDIGQIGDAWANFGFYGGIIFLFLYGAFNAWTLKVIFNLSQTKFPSLILWAPIIFLQLLKVEVSVVTNFNAAIKGAVFIALIFGIAKFLKIRI